MIVLPSAQLRLALATAICLTLGSSSIVHPTIVTASAGSSAKGQDVFVSKKVGNFNFGSRAAVNSNNGDVLVTWIELRLSDSTYSQVWGALLKRKASGAYKLKKPKRLSPKQGYHTNVKATWIPQIKQFVAAWDTRRIPTQPSDIIARLISKKGKPQEKAVTLVSDGDTNHSPLVAAVSEAEQTQRGAFGGAVANVFWHSTDGDRVVVNYMHLSANRSLIVGDGSGAITGVALLPFISSGDQFTIEEAAFYRATDPFTEDLIRFCNVMIAVRTAPSGDSFIEITSSLGSARVTVPGQFVHYGLFSEKGIELIYEGRDGRLRYLEVGVHPANYEIGQERTRPISHTEPLDIMTGLLQGEPPKRSTAAKPKGNVIAAKP